MDYAVVPLACFFITYYSLLSPPPLRSEFKCLNSKYYNPENTHLCFNDLKQLPALIITNFIGSSPDTLAKYMNGVDRFIQLHDILNLIPKTVYEEAGVPKQIYYITKMGAYEIPFAWWYKCIWLGGYTMDVYEISSEECPAVSNSTSQLSPDVMFYPYNHRIQDLLTMQQPASMNLKSGTLLSLLKSLPGVLPRRIFDKIPQEIKVKRDFWLDKIRSILDGITRKCFSKKQYVPEFSTLSEEYQMDQIKQYVFGQGFDLIKTYKGVIQNQTVCINDGCVQSANPVISTLSMSGQFGQRAIDNFITASVEIKPIVLLSDIADVSDDQYIFIRGLATSVDIGGWDKLALSYPDIPNGCNVHITAGNTYNEEVKCVCSSWGGCSANLQTNILQNANIHNQPSNSFSTIVFDGMGSLNVCDSVLPSASTGVTETCFPLAGDLIKGSNYSLLTGVKLPIGVTLEAYHQSEWECARFTCIDRTNPYHNQVKSTDISFMPTTTMERVIMNEVTYMQKTFTGKNLPWETMKDQTSELLLYDQRPKLGPDEVYCPPPFKRTFPDNSMKFREITEGPEFRLKVYTFEYYLNGVKTAELETLPCAEDIPLPSDSNTQQSILWPVNIEVMNRFNSYRNSNLKQYSPKICNNGGPGGMVPDANSLFDVLIPRKLTVNTLMRNGASLTMQQVADRVKNVISTLHSELQAMDSGCLSDSVCHIQKENIKGSATITDKYTTASPEIQQFCSKMKNDSSYGCMMFPAEAVGQEKRCGRYAFVDIGICEVRNDPYPCTWSKYYRCLNDAEEDKCYDSYKGRYKDYRNMKPTGRRMAYELTTTTNPCTHGDVMSCRLQDEITNFQSDDRPGLCPNQNKFSQDRTRRYNKMVLNIPPKIITKITQNLEMSGETTSSLTLSPGEISHVFLSLNPGYKCSSATPTCPAGEMPIQMRKYLWRCAACPMISSTYCKGEHNCLMDSPNIPVRNLETLDGWDNLTLQERAFLSETNSAIDVAISAVRWLVNQTMRNALTGVGLAYDVPEFMRTYAGVDFTYSPLSVIAYSNAMEIRSKTCTTEGVIPVFTNCSYDTNRRSLREFVGTRYKQRDGIVISPGTTMVWNVIRSQMISQNIPAWLASGDRAGMFWKELFDDKWCKRGTMQDNACYITNNGKIVVEVLNPGLLGDFEPMMGCDTKIVNGQRVVDAMCPTCPVVAPGQSIDLLIIEGGAMTCPQSYLAATGVTSNLEADSNLCGKTPSFDSTCSNLQGMLGQTSFDGDPINNVYSRKPWRGGLPPGIKENPLFSGYAPGNTISNLILKLSDIGGHCVSMELKHSKKGPIMSIVELPLSSYKEFRSANAVFDNTKLAWMQINIPRELDSMRTLYPNSICASWDCPLRRRAFYAGKRIPNGKSSPFRPSIPDPLRTKVLFGSMVHPTQKSAPMTEILAGTTRVLGVFYTSNGFCACASPPCKTCKSDEDALSGIWQTATAAPSGCVNQVDWPYPGGELRDASQYGNTLGASTCGILDRLPPFKYRYVNTKTPVPSTKTTLDKGGVCHMGWPVTTSLRAGCHVLPDSDTYVCPLSQVGPPSPLSRLKATTLDELLQAKQRVRLTECDKPPTYTNIKGEGLNPEVSYGQLRRLESSRLLAIDLRRKLCGNNSVCVPSADWELSSFWNNVYMKDFPSIPGGDGANKTLWDAPWAACKQHMENQTQTCQGTIDREEWIKGNRADICIKTIKSTPIANELAQPVNVCDLDESMDFFCRSIQDARYKVFEANCLYSGQCRQKLFFYQPSTYSIDNAQFVRSTVQQFYDSTVAGACVPDLDTAAAILANAENLKNCAALTLTTLAECIQVVRVIMDSLVEIVFYVGNLFLYVFEMLAVSNNDDLRFQIIQKINAILMHIKNSFLQLFNAFGDLIYKVLFDGPMGQWIMTVIIKICEFLNWVYMNILQVIICWSRGAILFILDSIVVSLVNILNAIAFGKLGYLYDDIEKAKTSVRESLTCDNKRPMDCNITFRNNPTVVTSMPLATRCWAGSEPGINSFACTAADTCLNSDFSKVVCSACPMSSSMIQFGCNTMTKLCSCNIFIQDTSFCSSHEECTIESDSVECEFVDSYLEPSYGHIPCRQCPKPICLISDGSGVGKCTCLLRPIPNQGCVGLGDSVSPSASNLCLVTTAGGGQGASSTYTQTYRTLASAPCTLLNQAASYCMQVYTSATSSAPMVVGLSLLKTFNQMNGRRLLHNGSISTPEEFSSSTLEWGGEGEPCKTLVAANASRLGILEKYTLSECWRWRDIGVQLIAKANMTHINPTFLVSWQDLLNTMLSEGAIPEILGKLPFIIHSIILHAEAAQPIYVTLLYWTSFLPQETWFNQTMLDLTKQYLTNLTHPEATGRQLLSSETKQHTPVKTREWENGPYSWMPHHIYWNLPVGRRLLTNEPITIQSATTNPSVETVYDWSQGPYTWPPNFNYWKGENSCAVVSTAVGVVKNGLDITMKFYQNTIPEPNVVKWPSLPLNDRVDIQTSLPNSTEVGEIIRQYIDQVFNKTYIDDYLDTAPYASGIKSLIQCNFTRIQTCSDRYDLFWSTFQVIVVLMLIGIVGRLLEIPYIEVLLVLFFFPLLMYSAYGYALTCVPLIPVCALRDLISVLDFVLPNTIAWPDALVTTPGCKEAKCMRSCVNELDIGFASWYDHLAWVMCETDSKWCLKVFNSLESTNPLKEAIRYKYPQGDNPESTRAARGICFTVTLVNSAPILMLALIVLWFIPSAIGMFIAGVQFIIATLFSFILFVHDN
jgi:hypothetical protein